MKDNVVLIGMPGCGKSTCGVLAAKALCKSFLDTDLLLQTQYGAGLQQIINEKGPAFFAQAERQVLCALQVHDAVIATGGSAVYYPDAMEHLRRGATVVYLRVSFACMTARIRNMSTRGILLPAGETPREMFLRREPLYRQYADATVDCDDLSVEQTVEAICRLTNPV